MPLKMGDIETKVCEAYSGYSTAEISKRCFIGHEPFGSKVPGSVMFKEILISYFPRHNHDKQTLLKP